jgi:hypothetical protein
MAYVQNSAYAACVLHAMRYFRREQFLFLRYEDVVHMGAVQVVQLLGGFLGLTVDEQLLRSSPSAGCDPAKSRSMSFVARSPTGPDDLAHATPRLEWFFGPYNRLLRDLIGHEFRWDATNHMLDPISAAEKRRRQETLDLIVAKRNARIKRQDEERKRHNRAARAFRQQQRTAGKA